MSSSSTIYETYAASISPASTTKGKTVQTQPIPGREAEMGANNGGGFSFLLDSWGVLDRFIMIGSEGGNYYVGQQDVTKQSFANTLKLITEDGLRVVARVVEYSVSGRAPKNDPALVVLALCAAKGNPSVQAAAYEALPKVARIGTHLFTFVGVLNALGKWNAAAKRGLAKWYTNRQIDKLAVQVLKYQSRNGWSHRDVLRLAHVKPQNPAQDALFHWVAKEKAHKDGLELPKLVQDFEALHRADSAKEVLRLIRDNEQISWELIPTQFLKDVDVLMALLPNMGMTAVIRQLGKLSALGVVGPLTEGTKLVVKKLTDAESIKSARVHPITILQAMKQYAQGRGDKGSLVWTPNQSVTSALDTAFYSAFTNVEPSGKNFLLGVDISGSMMGSRVNGSPNLCAAEVAAVMAMAIARTEPNHWIAGFNQRLKALNVSPTMRLDEALKVLNGQWDGGSTDCAKAYEYATANKLAVDTFVIITDNETNSGRQAPVQALNEYRRKTGRPAKSVVIGTSVSQFTIADPKDRGMLDIAGFDSAAPAIISAFSKE